MTKEAVLRDHGGAQFSAFKPALAELAVEKLSPIAGEMRRLLADPGHIDRILGDGAGRAAAIADETFRGVKDVVGFLQSRQVRESE
jgi:tryptophanyl-tRNA synthetase